MRLQIVDGSTRNKGFVTLASQFDSYLAVYAESSPKLCLDLIIILTQLLLVNDNVFTLLKSKYIFVTKNAGQDKELLARKYCRLPTCCLHTRMYIPGNPTPSFTKKPDILRKTNENRYELGHNSDQYPMNEQS